MRNAKSRKNDDSNSKRSKGSQSKFERNIFTYKRLFALISVLFGIFIAGIYSNSSHLNLQDIISKAQGEEFVEFFSDFKNVLPSTFLKDVWAIVQRDSELSAGDAFAIGNKLKDLGYSVEYPVVMVPGVISTGLENWGMESGCSESYFRKRLWGSWTMLRAMLLDKDCWKKHIQLDFETGMDPKGYKLRAAQGFDAADYFVAGYWIWSKIIENLSVLGYDPNTMFSASYDWRLSYMNLEKRDNYFLKLKSFIELSKAQNGKRTILLSHSMGSQIAFWFMKWVEDEKHGNAGKNWVNDHIEAFINVSGCLLGTPKSVSALLSGEMKDSAELNDIAAFGLEQFFSKAERAQLLRSLPGISSMLPKGGERIWGNSTFAADGDNNGSESLGSFIRVNDNSTISHLTVTESLEFLKQQAPEWYRKQLDDNYSHGIALTQKEVNENNKDPRKWINPLEVSLPYAPDTKIFCIYGVGIETERAYNYRKHEPNDEIMYSLDIDGSDIERGIRRSDGDGTVSLVSAGYMCNKGWKIDRYNPAKMNITVVELKHKPITLNPRGGPGSAEHVSILGSSKLNELILQIASGHGSEIDNYIISDIEKIADAVNIPT